MDSIVPADGLFEQQKPKDAGTEEEERLRKHQRNLKNAISHALLLQQRKDVEQHILETIEALTELPAAATSTTAERQQFTEGVAPFQPDDYDDLVDERVAQARCGYTLCMKKPRSLSTKTWALNVDAGKFCSSSCLQKSIQTKVQLNPVPVWERGSIVQIILPDSVSVSTARDSNKRNANAELAFERGEKVTSKKSETVISATVVEQAIIGQALPPQPSADTIEGYAPKNLLIEDVDEPIAETRQPPLNPLTVHQPPEDDEEQQWRDMFENLRVKRQG